MKLAQALDERSRVVLLSLPGAEAFLLSFPVEHRDAIARAAAAALESEVPDDCTDEQALDRFSALVGGDLVEYLRQEGGGLVISPPRKPTLPS